MVQGNYPRHPSFRHTIRHKIAAPSSVLMGDGAAKLPPSPAIPPCNTTQNRSTIIRFDGRWCKEFTPLGGYTFDRAGLMSAAKSTLSGRNPHEILPPWGLYFFKFPAPFPHHPRFRECVNYDDAMP